MISRRVISFLVPGVSLLGPPLLPPPPLQARDQRPVAGQRIVFIQVFVCEWVRGKEREENRKRVCFGATGVIYTTLNVRLQHLVLEESI